MSTYKIAVIPGDGIGKEVMPEGLRALEAAGAKFGIDYEFTELHARSGQQQAQPTIRQIKCDI